MSPTENKIALDLDLCYSLDRMSVSNIIPSRTAGSVKGNDIYL
jgi:hypothetical protein